MSHSFASVIRAFHFQWPKSSMGSKNIESHRLCSCKLAIQVRMRASNKKKKKKSFEVGKLQRASELLQLVHTNIIGLVEMVRNMLEYLPHTYWTETVYLRLLFPCKHFKFFKNKIFKYSIQCQFTD